MTIRIGQISSVCIEEVSIAGQTYYWVSFIITGRGLDRIPSGQSPATDVVVHLVTFDPIENVRVAEECIWNSLGVTDENSLLGGIFVRARFKPNTSQRKQGGTEELEVIVTGSSTTETDTYAVLLESMVP